jgi:hypothetical protein
MEAKRRLVVKVKKPETEKQKARRLKQERKLEMERAGLKYYNFVWPASIVDELNIPEGITANEYILALIRNDIGAK